jgi:hypothetical protein
MQVHHDDVTSFKDKYNKTIQQKICGICRELLSGLLIRQEVPLDFHNHLLSSLIVDESKGSVIVEQGIKGISTASLMLLRSLAFSLSHSLTLSLSHSLSLYLSISLFLSLYH